VLLHPVYVAGEATTSFVADHWGDLRASLQDELRPTSGEPAAARKGQERAFEVEVNRKLFHVRLTELLAESSAPDRRRVTRTSASARRTGNVLVSPMHGTVVAIKKQAGEPVAEGETVLIIEAMKMENEVGAHRSGTLTSLGVEVGETVDANQQLAVIE
jgi:acetyl-CoA/propionyl-CoA carboxylase biotin carboxyl carrier protein